jgi:3-hydroxyisobutyrate dehydrogenase
MTRRGEFTMIAYFGTGLLGANFVRALLRRGQKVQVWNRTAAKARALEADGAVAFDDPAKAAVGAARIHLTLSDDTAVDEVLERARPGFAPGVFIVDHSTTSPTGTAARAKRWADRGVTFQHAPLFMGPQQALEGSGLMLASGDRAHFDALAPELSKMTGKLLYLGPKPERAAGFKLLGNLFLMHLTTGIAEMLSLAKALHIPASEAVSLFESFNPGQTIQARAKRILDADFAHPSWELSMARKDARLMLEEAQRTQVPLPVLPAIAQWMDHFIAAGHGNDDWVVIARDALPASV